MMIKKSPWTCGMSMYISIYIYITSAFILLDSGTSKVNSLLVRQKVY